MSQSYSGLTTQEVEASRQKHGVNILTPKEKVPLWKQYLEKFQDPLIIILLVAGALSICISLYEYIGLKEGAAVFFEPVGIFLAILLATGLGFIFELKANKEFLLLNQVNDDEPIQVIRNGSPCAVPKKDIVVGDILILSTGEEIPADAELLEAVTLSVDESTLTGEPICQKFVDPKLFDPEATFPSNHVMRGTKIMEGHGIARVFAVGDQTENGKVFVAAQIDDSVKTPLNEQLDSLGALITKASYGFAALIIVGRLIMFFLSEPFVLVNFIAYLLQIVMIAVTLIVVAVPEGLPMAVTLSLAYSMRRMLLSNNLVRKMHACETMGAVTVICTDKTGTLTQNRMTVEEASFYGFSGQFETDAGLSIAQGIACNSTAELDFKKTPPEGIGNPTECALLAWLNTKGVDYRSVRQSVKVVEELPFNTMRKYMATIIQRPSGQKFIYVKGAPEILLNLSAKISGDVDPEKIKTELLGYQNKAMRTLAFACQELGPNDVAIADNKVVAKDLTFLGLVAITDPIRTDVPAAVKKCFDAGIKVKIVTGDTIGTAKEIGRQIGFDYGEHPENQIITGPEFAALTDDELKAKVTDLKIIARARPLDKERLVRALQANNEVVAVTGDGTNDAPALNAAHVGLSMGDGTSVAKEASDITIIDNSFASIGRAVMWGRSLYKNIQRFILFQMTVNVAACFTVLAGAFMGTESPLTVTQMLWVNLIMDTFAAMALASLPPSEDVMRDAPRSRTSFIIDPVMSKTIISVGVIFFAFLIGLVWFFEHTEINSVADIFKATIGPANKLSPYELSLFFTTFVMLQFWNMFNARAYQTGHSGFDLKGCSGFMLIAGIILIGQILIVSLFPQFFNIVPLHAADWFAIICGTSVVLWIGEILRTIKRTQTKNAAHA
ncbi:MAG: calcium-translocating P-type ATPase, PMCA-type [Desulfovibrionaceae bacterium]|nr:calcium-translocating P-type ATPase, PMCA-type [Desulfovibrionaceae bacterium]